MVYWRADAFDRIVYCNSNNGICQSLYVDCRDMCSDPLFTEVSIEEAVLRWNIEL